MTRRIPIFLLALLTLTGFIAGVVPQQAHADISPVTPAGRAATWLLSEVRNGVIPKSDGTPDWQLTSDAVLGLVAAGATRAQLDPLVGRLEAAVRDGHYGRLAAGAGQPPWIDGGALAKLLVVAQSTGRNPSSFGGVDLVDEVMGDLEEGRVGNGNVAGNTFGQAYVVLGLVRTTADPRPAIDALIRQQCPAGDFRLTLSAVACTSGASAADRDVTALAIHALRVAQQRGFGVGSSLQRAVDWFAGDQGANGSWIASPIMTAANSNTTGLGAQALAGLRPMAVSRAAGFTRSLQVDAGADSGAVAYDAESLAEGPARNRFRWQRATAQALFALARWDVYTVEGSHTHNGRQWRTSCEPYSQTHRCRTDIMATTVTNQGGQLVKVTGWTFNNLTYLTSTRSVWSGNPLGDLSATTQGRWTSGGREWRTECDTPATGNGCRAYIDSRFVAAERLADGTWRYFMKQDWVFNNIVQFS